LKSKRRKDTLAVSLAGATGLDAGLDAGLDVAVVEGFDILYGRSVGMDELGMVCNSVLDIFVSERSILYDFNIFKKY
jgi:hypothetical protein